MLLAGFLFSLMNVAVKLVSHIPAIEIILFRSAFSLVFTFLLLKQKKVAVLGHNKKLLVLRGIVGSIGLIAFFYTLQRIPLASAVTLNYLAPVFTAIMGIFIVKEKVRAKQFFYFGISFIGVLIIEGFDPRISVIDLSIALVASLAMGLAYNIIRKLNTSEHPLVIMIYFPMITLPIATIVSSLVWVQPSGWDWLILLAVGILTQFAQYFLTLAYQNANVAKISSLSYLSIIYALSFGFLIFGETYNIMTYLGMSFVLAGVIFNIRK
ncbi:DMT family transporter [Mongoliibacter ruber]|uniref:EamA domain-containing membrane protein RarD n=1 Tax=Mongoliibacter ruber TaxID=1750599 RepID=A0A2T0WV43_9BACT|nr:DMT family transporter [Mongoliibacter ruber]PRY90539.1 EamA domain-containing membrane protein RarD [Mongoliibacter ruber]